MCVDHFPEEQVVRFNDPGKKMYTKLKPGAVPSIFDGQPGYLTSHHEEAMTNFTEENNMNNSFDLLNSHKDKINCLNTDL